MRRMIQLPLYKTGTPAPHDGVYTPHSHVDGSAPHPQEPIQPVIRAGSPLPPCKTCGKPVQWIWSRG